MQPTDAVETAEAPALPGRRRPNPYLVAAALVLMAANFRLLRLHCLGYERTLRRGVDRRREREAARVGERPQREWLQQLPVSGDGEDRPAALAQRRLA